MAFSENTDSPLDVWWQNAAWALLVIQSLIQQSRAARGKPQATALPAIHAIDTTCCSHQWNAFSPALHVHILALQVDAVDLVPYWPWPPAAHHHQFWSLSAYCLAVCIGRGCCGVAAGHMARTWPAANAHYSITSTMPAWYLLTGFNNQLEYLLIQAQDRPLSCAQAHPVMHACDAPRRLQGPTAAPAAAAQRPMPSTAPAALPQQHPAQPAHPSWPSWPQPRCPGAQPHHHHQRCRCWRSQQS